MRSLLALGLLLLSPPLPALEEVYGTASQGASMQKRHTSARAAGVGGNGASLQEGADSLLSNPAALARSDGLEVGVHHQSWLANINQESATVAGQAGWGAWGLGLDWVDYGTIEAMDEFGQPLGTVGAQDYNASLAWARTVGAGLSVGGSGHFGQSVIAGESLVQSSLDLGLHWAGERWACGLVFANVGATLLSGERGSSAMRGELSGDISSRPGALRALGGFSAEPNGLSRLQAGLESGWSDSFVLRAGYESRLGATLVEGFAGTTLGLGFAMGPLFLDYAYLPFGDLGTGHRISMKWRMSKKPAAPSAVPLPEPPPVPAAPLPLEPPPVPTPVAIPTLAPIPPLEALPTPLPTPPLAIEETQVKVTEDALELARKAEDSGDRESALAIHKGLLSRFPENPVIWRSLGDLHYRAGEKDAAVEAYDQALQKGLMNGELEDWLTKYRSQP